MAKMERNTTTYSQNFITDPNLVKKLLSKSNISGNDTVVEIGAGKGIITKELIEYCKEVIAVEIDKNLYTPLQNRIKAKNLTLLNDDILNVTLPENGYNVFSNIPFNYTARIMDKLFFQGNPPQSAYLIMQKEAGDIYTGTPRETQKSLLLKPFFDISVFYKFDRTDFKPTPSVQIDMLSIKKLEQPYINRSEISEYFDFIVYGTIQHKLTLKRNLAKVFTHEQFKRLSQNLGFSYKAKPLDLAHNQWLRLYEYYKTAVIGEKKAAVRGSYNKQLIANTQFKKLTKTRVHGN